MSWCSRSRRHSAIPVIRSLIDRRTSSVTVDLLLANAAQLIGCRHHDGGRWSSVDVTLRIGSDRNGGHARHRDRLMAGAVLNTTTSVSLRRRMHGHAAGSNRGPGAQITSCGVATRTRMRRRSGPPDTVTIGYPTPIGENVLRKDDPASTMSRMTRITIPICITGRDRAGGSGVPSVNQGPAGPVLGERQRFTFAAPVPSRRSRILSARTSDQIRPSRSRTCSSDARAPRWWSANRAPLPRRRRWQTCTSAGHG